MNLTAQNALLIAVLFVMIMAVVIWSFCLWVLLKLKHLLNSKMDRLLSLTDTDAFNRGVRQEQSDEQERK